MKKPLLLLLSSILFHLSFAQVSFVTYFTKDNKETKDPKNAVYYRTITIDQGENTPVEVVEKYVDTEKMKLYGTYNNMKDKKFVGDKFQAYNNGKIKSKERFSYDGILIDTAQYYHPSGKLKIAYYYPHVLDNQKTKVTDTLILIFRDSIGKTHLINGEGYAEIYNEDIFLSKAPSTLEKGNYSQHKRQGEWTGYFMDAKYQFSETYDNNGKLISGVSIDTVNNKYPYDINTYMSQPEYPGGVTRFREFIAKNYQYPTEALKQNLSGRIQASFVVNSKGEITKIKIDKDLGYGTGQEAINLLKTSKKWKPGIMRGVPVNVSYTIPITINTRTM